MRATEFITEVKMSPNTLLQFAKKQTDILAGFEAEMVIPGTHGGKDKLDLRRDKQLPTDCSLDDIKQFFKTQSIDSISDEYADWASSLEYEFMSDELDNKLNDLRDENPDLNEDELSEKADSELYNEFYDNLEEHDAELINFFYEKRIRTYSELYKNYSDILTWPYIIHAATFTSAVSEYAKELGSVIGQKLIILPEHNKITKELTKWYIEPDDSIKVGSKMMGVEVVSPPMPIFDMLSKLKDVLDYTKSIGGSTNSSTGFHVGISVNEATTENLDYIKLALFLGDDYVLEKFGRSICEFAKSSVYAIKKEIRKKSNADIASQIEKIKNGLITSASRSIQQQTEHVTGSEKSDFSINVRHKYVEFRSMGDDYINQFESITNTILRYVKAYKIACDPNEAKQEYVTKLYKLISSSCEQNEITPVAQYIAGNISQQQLVKNISDTAEKQHENK